MHRMLTLPDEELINEYKKYLPKARNPITAMLLQFLEKEIEKRGLSISTDEGWVDDGDYRNN